MTGFRPRLAPTLFTVPALIVLLGLGTWQVQRLHWKEGLIAQREAMVAAPPIAPPQTLAEATANQFRHVAEDGVLLNDKEIYLAATSDSGDFGYQVLTPLQEAGGRRIDFVNRGFIPLELKDPKKRAAGRAVQARFTRRPLTRATGAKADFLPTRQSPRPRSVVLGRFAGDGEGSRGA